MGDPRPDPESSDAGNDLGARPDRGSTTGTPRWVKVAGIIAALLILLFVVLMLTGRGGGHGPGRHAPVDDASDGHRGPPPGVTHP